MQGHELHARGLITDREAIVAALVDDGWPQDDAEALLARHAGDVKASRWRRWTDPELAECDRVLAEAGGSLPGAAVTRPMAKRLHRSHKSVISQLERRMAAAAGM